MRRPYPCNLKNFALHATGDQPMLLHVSKTKKVTGFCHCSASSNGMQTLLDAAAECKKLLIFTGSGLSATSGMALGVLSRLSVSPVGSTLHRAVSRPGS